MKKEKPSWLSMQFEKLKEKFLEDLQDRKKIQALEHLAEVRNYRQKNLVKLVAEEYRTGFLEPEEQQFLDYVLSKYKIDYLNWCHKTRALKMEMAKIKGKYYKTLAKKKTREQQNGKIVQLPLFPEAASNPFVPGLEKKAGIPSLPLGAIKGATVKRWIRA